MAHASHCRESKLRGKKRKGHHRYSSKHSHHSSASDSTIFSGSLLWNAAQTQFNVFIVSLLCNLILPGIQWRTLGTWVLVSFCVALLMTAMRILLGEHLRHVLGRKFSGHSIFIKHTAAPFSFFVASCLFLFLASLLLSDFEVLHFTIGINNYRLC